MAEGWAEFTDALLMEIGVVMAGSGTRPGGAAAVAALVDGLADADRSAVTGWELSADLRDGPGLDPESSVSCGTLAWALTVLEALDPGQGTIGFAAPTTDGRVTRVIDLASGPRVRIVAAGPDDLVDDVVERARRLHSDDGGAGGVPTVDELAPHRTGVRP